MSSSRKIRKIRKIIKSKPVVEGAGVRLKRAFGFGQVPMCDPFLLLDDFRSDDPQDYVKGFPWHPHRGIETITYVIRGDVAHGDSMGNKGDITSGDVQWMTAGSGVIHQEMPKGDADGRMEGFQLWANLPAAQKMMHPRYRDVKADRIPVVRTDDGVEMFEDGDHVLATAEDAPVRFLLVSGKPLNEPVAWRGPIVMNEQAELETAFAEYQAGTFVKRG